MNNNETQHSHTPLSDVINQSKHNNNEFVSNNDKIEKDNCCSFLLRLIVSLVKYLLFSMVIVIITLFSVQVYNSIDTIKDKSDRSLKDKGIVLIRGVSDVIKRIGNRVPEWFSYSVNLDENENNKLITNMRMKNIETHGSGLQYVVSILLKGKLSFMSNDVYRLRRINFSNNEEYDSKGRYIPIKNIKSNVMNMNLIDPDILFSEDFLHLIYSMMFTVESTGRISLAMHHFEGYKDEPYDIISVGSDTGRMKPDILINPSIVSYSNETQDIKYSSTLCPTNVVIIYNLPLHIKIRNIQHNDIMPVTNSENRILLWESDTYTGQKAAQILINIIEFRGGLNHFCHSSVSTYDCSLKRKTNQHHYNQNALDELSGRGETICNIQYPKSTLQNI